LKESELATLGRLFWLRSVGNNNSNANGNNNIINNNGRLVGIEQATTYG